MGTNAEATYYDNSYFIAHPVRRSARLEALGRIGQNTVIPWMRLLGLASVEAEIRNVGTVSTTLYAYTGLEPGGRDPGTPVPIPPELKDLRPFVVRAIGDLMRVCGVRRLELKSPLEEVVKDMLPTWQAFAEMPEPAIRAVDDGKA